MPDEAPAEKQDTPDVPASESQEGTPAESTEDSPQAPETNWQDRYENLQPEYTRATQEASQYRQIIDLARQGDPEAIEALGLSLAEEDTEDEDEYADPDQRLDAMEQFLAQRLQEEEAQQEEERWIAEADKHVQAQVAELEKEHGKLAEDEVAYLLDLSRADENGMPDLLDAYKRDTERLEGKRKSWVETKRTPQVQSGASASSQPDLDDPEQRREYIARRMAEADALT
jgi:hypothetical protein